jgi:hypothetical protein
MLAVDLLSLHLESLLGVLDALLALPVESFPLLGSRRRWREGLR